MHASRSFMHGDSFKGALHIHASSSQYILKQAWPELLAYKNIAKALAAGRIGDADTLGHPMEAQS